MEYASFARSDKKVSRLGYGCWGIGKSLWIGADDAESKRAMRRAIDEGVTLFDTARVYGNGHSEKLVGEVERESGKQLFIASKVPSNLYEWPAQDSSTLEESFPYEHIIESTEQSLRSLKRGYIDLMQFHVWNDAWTPRDEWKEAVYKLKKDGKVRQFGISINDHQPANGIEAGKTGLIDCFQVIFNIFEQSPIDELFPFCEKEKISILARVPLDEGGLTGNITPETKFPEGDWRNHYFRGNRKAEVYEHALKLSEAVKGECSSLAEAALRYIISFDAVTSVIPGMRSEKNLRLNVDAVEKGKLSPALLEELKNHRWLRDYNS